ncbi:MAG TPA: hypothetical protein VHQ65_05870, partial [Thermoanaerobaculia bacterium]|nr:hypothetical protein [Thermoanaerobaculia bacterium]
APRPRWGRVALAATVALLLLAAGGTWWAQRTGLIGTESAGGVLGPLPLHPDEVTDDAADSAPEPPSAGAATGTAVTADTAPEGAGEILPASRETIERAVPPAHAPTRLENLTWSAGGGRTDLLLWTDGAVGPGSYSHFLLGGERPRLVVRLRGIEQPYARGQVAVGTAQVERIRTGFHSDRQPSELHVVFDLPGPRVELASIEGIGGRLRIVLEGP